MAAEKKEHKGGARPRWRPEYVTQAHALCTLGYTDEKLAEFFRVGIATLYRWKNRYPEFKVALRDGKEVKDAQVMSALFQRAVGSTVTKEKIVMVDGKAEVHAVREEVPPDTPAALFWMTNRRPDLFKKDPKPIEQDGENAQPLSITFGVDDPVKEVRVTRGKPKA